jgi:S1-C subfamily serine protease
VHSSFSIQHSAFSIPHSFPPIRVIQGIAGCARLEGMTNLAALSNELADLVTAASPAVVQVLGGRRPASGVVHGANTIITTARAIGREEGLRARLPGADEAIEAELAGWDPSTGIAVLRTRASMHIQTPAAAPTEPRTGEIVVALARSWTNVVSASAGIVAVVGGPLRTGRRRQIARVFRITAPLHDGFAGGGIFDGSGQLAGIATASAIRGFAVGIPASIALDAAARVLGGGTGRRGFVGLAVQPVLLAASQQKDGRERALLIIGVTPASPAEAAGLLVGDLLLEFDGQPTASVDELLDLLTDRRVGQEVTARVLRGGEPREVRITVGDRPRGSGAR